MGADYPGANYPYLRRLQCACRAQEDIWRLQESDTHKVRSILTPDQCALCCAVSFPRTSTPSMNCVCNFAIVYQRH